jgi:hypothetical protein
MQLPLKVKNQITHAKQLQVASEAFKTLRILALSFEPVRFVLHLAVRKAVAILDGVVEAWPIGACVDVDIADMEAISGVSDQTKIGEIYVS